MYSSTLPSTSTLGGVGGQRHSPTALPRGKTRYPLYRRLGRPQGRSGRVRKILSPSGILSLDRPARSESLYGLSYLRPSTVTYFMFMSLEWDKRKIRSLYGAASRDGVFDIAIRPGGWTNQEMDFEPHEG